MQDTEYLVLVSIDPFHRKLIADKRFLEIFLFSEADITLFLS